LAPHPNGANNLYYQWMEFSQIDFVQAYPQAKAEMANLYMEIPKGFA